MKTMTLEDFFTLAEMNNGLMVPSRVRELVTVMMNDTGCYAKNVSEATRQWSALAKAIAATENKDCLSLFIQLDGLKFVYKWLKDAQKYSNEASDSFVEESITHLLQVLEKLHDVNEKMFSSEIWTVINDLRSHNSLKVQDEARVLFESWEKKRTGEDKNTSGDSVSDVGTNGDLTADGMECVNIVTTDVLEYCLRDTFPSDKAPIEEKVSETATCMDDLHPGPVESEPNPNMLLDPLLTDDRPLDHIGSCSISNATIEPPVHPTEGATSATVSCSDVSGKCRELELISDVKDITKIGSSPWKLRLLKEPNLLEEIPFPSSLDAADAMDSSTEPTSLSVSGDKNLCGEGSTWIDQKVSGFDEKVAMSNGHSNRRQSSSAFDTKEEGEFNHHVLWSSSGGKTYQGNLKDERTVLLPNEDDGKINTRHDLSICDYVLATDYCIFKKGKDRGSEPSGNKSTVDLDYGLLDPLEFARQVAIEVEREVVDYTEQSCSSEKLPGENVQPSCSLDSVSGYRSHTSGGSSKEAANDLDLSAEASSGQEESSAGSKDTNAEPTDGIQDVEISQVTAASQEETNEKGVCKFDLNVEVCSEDADRPINQFSAPVSIVSASRPVAALGFPTAPLQFGGNLGWKGSASTSAFRPASSHRIPDIHKNLSNGGRSIISKNRQELLDIDLNVAESGDGRTRGPSTDKLVIASLSLPSGESSVEMRSRSEHIALDLNLASEGEGGGGLTDWRAIQLFPQRYFQQSLSNSSTSSIKQPSVKNIDLNDHPSFTNDSFDHSHLSKYSQNLNFPESVKSDDSVISILGARVEVNHKEFASQTQPIPNGKTSELAFDINSGRTGSFLGMGSVLPYVHPTFYGYNNIAPAPAHGLPFSSSVYGPGGPIPYMVDSRGAPVIPQIVGSASAFPTAFSQPPFFLNPTHSSLSYSVGSSGSMLDLNSGTTMEGGNKDPTSLGLFLNSGLTRPMDEQMWSISQPTISSGFGGKRKEPENGWEHYPPKPHTPPWI